MTEKELKEKLHEPYRLHTWQEIVRHIFKNPTLFTTEAALPLFENVEYVQKAFQFGTVSLHDDRQLALIDVKLSSNKVISKNRVQLRELIAKYVDGGKFQGILALFHSADTTQQDYRLTFIAKSSSFNEEGEFVTKQTYPKRYTYILGQNESCTTAAQRLTKYLGDNNRAALKDVIEAFSVEKLSNDFFAEYKYNYEKKFLAHLMPLKNTVFEGNDKAVRDFCKRLLGRIVFLYFVQKKRWLGATVGQDHWEGDTNFLLSLFKEVQAQDQTSAFYSHWLSKLFFETLNTKREGDLFRMPTGKQVKVPYLNGGLFYGKKEPEASLISFPAHFFHQNDDKKADKPNERGLFDFMNSFNFTIYEDSPEDQTVAVDPEMLGHIFENLLEENREKGAIYTPKDNVHFMCQQSLIHYLNVHLNPKNNPTIESQIRQVVVQKNINNIPEDLLIDIDNRLEKIKICDPAIGSGAFPMGLLQEIFAIKEIIYFARGFKSYSSAKVKENIIQKSIYGVDLDAGAVDIARLRFWLSLIVDEEKPRALPNLDYKIVEGDSLVPKFENQIVEIEWNKSHTTSNQFLLEGIRDSLRKVVEKQRAFFSLNDDDTQPHPTKEALQQEIRDIKIDLLINQLALSQLEASATNVSQGGLFALPKSKAEQKAEEDLRQRTAGYEELIVKLRALKQNPEMPLRFFDWKLTFAEILNEQVTDEKGFDIVIANPPYMRVQGIQANLTDEKKYIETEKDYREITTGAYEFANLFFVMTVKKLSKENGSNCFIFPHKFFNSDSSAPFRSFLRKGMYIDKIAHFGANRVFNDADTYVCIAFFSKKANAGFKLQKFAHRTNFIPHLNDESRYEFISYETLDRAAKAYGGNQWIFFRTAEEYQIFEKIYQHSSKIEEVFEDIFQGIATSNDNLFLIEVEREDEGYLYGKNKLSDRVWQVEKAFFKPMLRGRDVQRYAPLHTDNYVFFPYQVQNKKAAVVPLKTFEDNYPYTFQYIMEQEAIFKARESGKAAKMSHWYEYIYPKNLVKFEQPKLSSMEICTTHPNVTFNEGNFYHNTKVYSWVKKENISASYEYLLAIANSAVLWWFLKNTGDTLQGDARTLKTNYLNPFPIPLAVSTHYQEAIAHLVKYVIYLTDTAHPQVHPSIGNGAVAQYLRQVIDGCVFELYFGEEMKAKRIDILPFVATEIKPYDGQPQTILQVYQQWQRPDSQVRNRLKLMAIESPHTIAHILNV
ncbi:Eco57I restriction-modification methylase domain-containing protein [Runella sp.]|uniref:Eco57I restriction-modification methylase domain-containing protein n=1 Tax=Runella sp. TaxID=1960881 RepID=UPI002631072B|nr:N-6 DNA methylase [Runella sp.]